MIRVDKKGGKAPILPAKTMYVEAANGDDGNDGSITAPKKTIQAAINALGAPVDGPDEMTPRNIYVFSGGYDENLTIPSAGMWHLIALGHVTLGDRNVQYLSSSTPRSITWNADQAAEFSQARPVLHLTQAFLGGYAGSTHVAYGSTGWDISGNITHTQSSFTSTELYLYGVKVRGNLDCSTKSSTLTIMLEKCYIVGTTTGGAATRLDYASDCEFDGLVTMTNLGKISQCEIDSITYTSFATTLLKPVGFFQCHINGTLTAPATQYKADGTTQALSTSIVLAGGATLTDLQ